MAPSIAREVMQKLYGESLWRGFRPRGSTAAPQGWNGNHPSLGRLAGASGHGPAIAIDVGVWKGQSTISLATAMKAASLDGCVIAVDTFLGSAEHWSAQQLYSRRHGLPDIYETFLDNVCNADLADYIVPMPQTSTTAAIILAQLKISASLVHIDAAHEYAEVLRDAESYWKLLNPGGYLIGDDYHETWPGVVKAAGEFSSKTGRPLTVEPPKWILQKT
jgi:predicted O-methyltransferase YrrM